MDVSTVPTGAIAALIVAGPVLLVFLRLFGAGLGIGADWFCDGDGGDGGGD